MNKGEVLKYKIDEKLKLNNGAVVELIKKSLESIKKEKTQRR